METERDTKTEHKAIAQIQERRIEIDSDPKDMNIKALCKTVRELQQTFERIMKLNIL